MKQQQPTDALFGADASSVDRIAALCQVNWDEDRGFEQSYQKYRGTQVTPMPRVVRRDPMRSFITAACLLMAVGCAGGVYAYRQIAPSSNPIHQQLEMPTQETAATETASTDTTVETPEPMPVVIETQETSQPSTQSSSTIASTLVVGTAQESSGSLAETTLHGGDDTACSGNAGERAGANTDSGYDRRTARNAAGDAD